MNDDDPYKMKDWSRPQLLNKIASSKPDTLEHQYAQIELRKRERKPSTLRELKIIRIATWTLIFTVLSFIIGILIFLRP